MAKIAGKYLTVLVGGTAYTAIRSSSLEMAADMIDVTTADSTGGWKEYITGELGGTINVEGLYDHASAEGTYEAFADMVAGTTLTWKYGEVATGTKYLTGDALVSNISVSGDKNDAATYSFTLQVTGAIETATNA